MNKSSTLQNWKKNRKIIKIVIDFFWELCIRDSSQALKTFIHSLFLFSTSSCSTLWNAISFFCYLINFPHWKPLKLSCASQNKNALKCFNNLFCKKFCKINPMLLKFPASNQPSSTYDQTEPQPLHTTSFQLFY